MRARPPNLSLYDHLKQFPADVAQLVAHPTCNRKVGGSSPPVGSPHEARHRQAGPSRCTFGAVRQRYTATACCYFHDVVRRAVTSLRQVGRRARGVVGIFVFAGIVLSDLVRVLTSPILGSVTWIVGTMIGLTLGVASAACWIRAGYRPSTTTRMPWWAWVTILAWVVALVTAHAEHDHVPPATTSGYIVGALWYGITGFAGTAILLVIAFTSRRQGRCRIHATHRVGP
jgi:hypothetical protein